ncbi:MAG: PAS domain-containing protein [Deltaproteobacteria bacterium]|nr:PAS domain-containing protein [Deltaproteobacteria bacterium]
MLKPQEVSTSAQTPVSNLTVPRLFATTLSNLSAFVYSSNSRYTKPTFISDSIYEVTGYEKAKFTSPDGWSIHDIVSLADQHRVEHEINAALADKNPFEVVYRLKRNEGEEKWLHERGRGIYAANGKLNAVEGVVSDITQAHNAEEALRRRVEAYALVSDMSRRFLSLKANEFNAGIVSALADMTVLASASESRLMESSPDGESLVCSYSSRFGGIRAQTLYLNNWHWLYEQQQGRDYFIINNVKQLPDSAKTMREQLVKDNVDSFIWIPLTHETQVHNSGICLLWRGRETNLADTDLTPFVVIADAFAAVTRRHRIEQALQASEAGLTRITNALPGAVFQLHFAAEGNARFVFASRWAEEFLGVSREKLYNDINIAAKHIVLEDRASVFSSIEKSRNSLQEWSHEFRMLDRDGIIRWLRGSAMLEKAFDGGVICNGIVIDISQQKQLEAQLQMKDRLGIVGTLASGMAHEINNPLSYIRSNLVYCIQTLEDTACDHAMPNVCDDMRTALRDALEGSDRVRNIVADLRTFSRADHELTKGMVDIQRAVETAVRMVQSEVRYRAHLRRELNNVPKVFANESRLIQVFINLLVNAMQAMPERDYDLNEIYISTAQKNDRVVVVIRDNGKGISKEVLNRIFDPFFTTHNVGVGPGLGLAVCHGIVSTLGGEINVDSQLEIGTTVTILLPIAHTELKNARNLQNKTTEHHPRVLAIDDEPLMLTGLRRLLWREYELDTASSATEALSRIANNDYDIILCDLMMPGRNGMDLYSLIENSHPTISNRFIFLTGGAFTPSMNDFANKMGDRVISKPPDVEELLRLMKRVLDLKKVS